MVYLAELRLIYGAFDFAVTACGDWYFLWDVSTGSQARTAPDTNGGWSVVQRGPVPLWDRVERAMRLWQDAGEPHQREFGITVSAAGQRVWLGTHHGPSWDLPI